MAAHILYTTIFIYTHVDKLYKNADKMYDNMVTQNRILKLAMGALTTALYQIYRSLIWTKITT